MTAREFLEWAGFKVNEHTLSRLTDYIGSNIDFSQFPDAEVVNEASRTSRTNRPARNLQALLVRVANNPAWEL